MPAYDAPRVSTVRVSDVLTDLGPARASLYDECLNCGGHGGHGSGGHGGSHGWRF